jgi:hypothetical protein
MDFDNLNNPGSAGVAGGRPRTARRKPGHVRWQGGQQRGGVQCSWCHFLLVTFLLGKQKKSDGSAPGPRGPVIATSAADLRVPLQRGALRVLSIYSEVLSALLFHFLIRRKSRRRCPR